MPSFTWRSSHAIRGTAADSSVVAVPSAPPVPSSEASLASSPSASVVAVALDDDHGGACDASVSSSVHTDAFLKPKTLPSPIFSGFSESAAPPPQQQQQQPLRPPPSAQSQPAAIVSPLPDEDDKILDVSGATPPPRVDMDIATGVSSVSWTDRPSGREHSGGGASSSRGGVAECQGEWITPEDTTPWAAAWGEQPLLVPAENIAADEAAAAATCAVTVGGGVTAGGSERCASRQKGEQGTGGGVSGSVVIDNLEGFDGDTAVVERGQGDGEKTPVSGHGRRVLREGGCNGLGEGSDARKRNSWMKKERRMSPPWDDSSLELLDLSTDELVERVVQVSNVLGSGGWVGGLRCGVKSEGEVVVYQYSSDI